MTTLSRSTTCFCGASPIGNLAHSGSLFQRGAASHNTGAALVAAVAMALAGCGTNPVAKVDSHLRNTAQTPQSDGSPVPAPVRQVPIPPPPKPVVDEKRYSVSVIDVPAREILLAMSRDTGINIDIFPGIEGRVTLNAIDQTIRQILTRMAKQIDMRWEADGPNLSVMPDAPFLKLYRVDYVNITRDMDGTFGVQTQVVSPSGVGSTGAATGAGGGQNSSQLRIVNNSKNRFWENLEKNIKDLLRETDKLLPEGSSETVVRGQTQGSSTATSRTQQARAGTTGARGTTTTLTPGEIQAQNEQVSQTLTFREAASVIVNPETGTISVRATSRQHEKVGQFIELVAGAAKRQVLIEATIVEVELSDGYQSGVDWSSIALQGLGYSFRQQLTQTNVTANGTTNLANNFFSVGYSNPNAAVGGSIKSTITLLSSFGNAKVLSSPRTTTLNNQTAVMKVVENAVYFTITTTAGTTSANGNTAATYSSTPNIVPEGLVLSVTPQIGENDMVTLNIRPSITKIVGQIQDPNPGLIIVNSNPVLGSSSTQIPSRIPVVQTREFETVLRVASGQTTVLGGLMQDSFKATRDGLPVLSRIPIFGDAVSYRNDAGKKSELVVFIRPIVLREASVETDLSEYKRYLPDSRFFKEAEPAVNVRIPGIPDPVQPRQ
jgi:general secretion pathway protein D